MGTLVPLGQAVAYLPGSLTDRALQALSADATHPTSPESLAEAIGTTPKHAGQILRRLEDAGAATRLRRGQYVRRRAVA